MRMARSPGSGLGALRDAGAAAARDQRGERVARFRRRIENDRLERDPAAAQPLGGGRRIDEQRTRAGIGDDVAGLIEGRGRVDRHRHAACEEDAEIGEDPVDAVGRHQRHAVARREPARAQRCGDRCNPFGGRMRAEHAPVRAGVAFVKKRPVRTGERRAHEFNQRHTRRTSAKTRSRPRDFDHHRTPRRRTSRDRAPVRRRRAHADQPLAHAFAVYRW